MDGASSTLLKEQREKIISLWEERSRREIPSALATESLVLRESLPTYLDHLSEALATSRKVDIQSILLHDQESIRLGRLHGEDRAGQTSYVLAEVIFEYHILREVIFQVLEVDGQLPARQRDIVLDSIEQAVNDAAVKFSEVQADIQQTFINTLTHDLKIPITGAKMAAQLILRRAHKPEACIDLASKIVGSMNRLTSMIHDLLDAGRVRAGEPLALQFVECDLKEVIGEVVDEMAVIHGDRFLIRCDERCNGIWGCSGIRRALENLIGNAVKYGTAEGRIEIRLRCTETRVEISVHNEGPPIEEKDFPFLFKQYRRSTSAEIGSKTGWGLGLTLVKGVVDAHQGKVRIESQLASGTTFILDLPLIRETHKKV